MKVVLAFDSFKASVSAVEACAAAEQGVRRVSPTMLVAVCPLSDGGEGFAETLASIAGSRSEMRTVRGPLGEPVQARLVLLNDGRTAVVEAAQACGYALVPAAQRNPRFTTTYGVGELLREAVLAGAREIIIGLGGSATNDGGIGMLAALGWQFLDADGQPVATTGENLARIAHIEAGDRLPGIRLVVACDVTNPLYGPHGAAYTFAAQKGASPEDVALLDAGLRQFAARSAVALGRDMADAPGAGAAGGLGFALQAYLQAEFHPGAELAIALTGLEAQLANADLCLTGEGRTDFQTAYGKLPAAVAACCARAGAPCVCLSGGLGEGWRELYGAHITALFSICSGPQSLEAAMAATPRALADTAEAVVRLAAAYNNDLV